MAARVCHSLEQSISTSSLTSPLKKLFTWLFLSSLLTSANSEIINVCNIVSSALSLARIDKKNGKLTERHSKDVLNITKEFQKQLDSITRHTRGMNEAWMRLIVEKAVREVGGLWDELSHEISGILIWKSLERKVKICWPWFFRYLVITMAHVISGSASKVR